MKKLLEGLERFAATVHTQERELFDRLAQGQQPEVMFITCSDSRLNPNLLTQTNVGELFVLRNAGNIVPPYTGQASGEAGTVEYGVAVLKVKDIVVCGHSDCGAVKGILNPEAVAALPSVAAWLNLAERTRRIVRENYPQLPDKERLNRAIEINVLAQMDVLRTHPAVASAVEAGRVHLHGWVFDIGSGQMRAYDSASRQFLPLTGNSAVGQQAKGAADRARA